MATTTEIPRSVALVGRPNVGKSRLFNRLVGRRMSIVHDQPGVTRDLLTADVDEGGFLLMDTGGIGLFDAKLTPKVIADAVEEQVSFAIASASLVLLIADAHEGCVPLDLEVASRLRAAGKRVIVVANKADTPARDVARDEFYEIGFGDPVLVSAEHGRGVDFLLRRILEVIGPAPELPPADSVNPIRIALAGRPNVGKSSLGNRLLSADKLVVSEVAGTTRDPVRARLTWRDPQGVERLFELADTAGRRAATKRDTLEFLSHSRAQEILAATDVVFLIIDATQGVTRIDLQLAGELAEVGAGVVIVVNKWDLALEAFRQGPMGDFEDEREFRGRFQGAVRRALFFLPDPPLLFVSAKTGFRTTEMLTVAAAVYTRAGIPIPTARLNRALHDLLAKRPPRPRSGKLFKCYYATQVARRPIRFRLFCNTDEPLEDGYIRYLAKGLHDAFDLSGVPLFLELVGKPKQVHRGFFAPQGAAPGDLPSSGEAPAASGRPRSGGKSRPGSKSRPASKPRAEGKSRGAASPGAKPLAKRWGGKPGGPRPGKAGPTRPRGKSR
jgi:GTP-binding protein